MPLKAFTRNYQDNSKDAGFEFTFYCDICGDGYKSSFMESSTFRKASRTRFLSQGVGVASSLLGGRMSNLSWGADRAAYALEQRFDGQSPEWLREHEAAFNMAQSEVEPLFHRCQNCNRYVDNNCWNPEAGLCTDCAPRQEVFVAQAHADAMKRNITEAAYKATVWEGKIEQKTTTCPNCGQPAGTGKFCNNCGFSLALNECAKCGAENAQNTKFCTNCGNNMQAAPVPPPTPGLCAGCGAQNPPGTKFCGTCGSPL